MAVRAGHIDHVQRDDRGVAELYDLGRVIEVPLEVGRIDDDNDKGRRGQFRQPAQKDVSGYLFVQRLRAKAVGAWQIKKTSIQLGRSAQELAFFALDGDAGVVANLGAQPRQRIEKRGLAAIRVSGQDDVSRLRFRFRGRFLRFGVGSSGGRGWLDLRAIGGKNSKSREAWVGRTDLHRQPGLRQW